MHKKFIFSGAIILVALVLGFSIQDKKPMQKATDLPNHSGTPVLTTSDRTFSTSDGYVIHNGIDALVVQDFEGALFPPTGWTVEFTGTQYWLRATASGYGIGGGSAEMDYYDFFSGQQSLVTPTVTASVAGDSLKFDEAYATYITEVDTLYIETSTNGGTTYSNLVTLLGGTVVGTGMVTAPAQTAPFSPTAAQWATKKYGLPLGTNKIRFKAGTAFGNNLYVDNVNIGAAIANDVGTVSINIPSSLPPFATTPQSTVKNFGTATNTFTVKMDISPGGYTSTQTVTSLAGGATANVNFASWSPSVGTYNVKTYTQLATDGNPANDTLTSTVNVTSSYWVTGSSMPAGRDLGTGVGYSRNDTGWVYILGGELATTSVYRYNLRTNTWATMASLPLGKDRFGSAILKDSIYSIGGSTVDPAYTTDFYKYDIKADAWVSRASLPGLLGWCKGAGYQDSLIYVAGGYDGTSTLAQVLLYNAKTNSWRTATPLPAIRFGGGFAVKGDTLVYIAGVDGASVVGTVYRGVISQSDRSVITWTTGASMPGVYAAGMFRCDAHTWGSKGVIITGGSVTVPFSSVTNGCLVYSPGADSWVTNTSKTTAWTAGQSGVAASNGALRLVGAGGYNGTATIATTEVFTDSTTGYNTEVNITMLEEAYYNSVTTRLALRDTVTAYLRNSTSPYAIVDSAKGVVDSLGYTGAFYFSNANSGTYYIVVKQRNTLETWSASGVSYTRGGKLNYDFSFAATQAYGSNMKLVGTKFCVFSGDVNRDGFVNLTDIIAIFNDASSFATGYRVTDLNADNFTNLTDIIFAFNNSTAFVSLMRP